MIYRSFAMPLAIAASAAACGYASDTAHAATSAITEAETCLQRHIGTLDALLTLEHIAPYVKGAPEEVEVDYDKGRSHTLSYFWPSDRTRTMSGSTMKIELPIPNMITLGGIKAYTASHYFDRDAHDPVKRFQRAHRNMTAEERETARAAITENMKDEDEKTRKIAKTLLGAATERIMFEPVAGIGDAAAWNIRTKELDVLTGATEFSVKVDVSADMAKNKAVAMTLAQAVLDVCKDATNGE
ncbi:hypothetical protein SAMN05421666_3520 [Roseovarius nanhaiticus]|uniref:Secreted protein n=1 Tax=Roseovarius nanhaiticus TaxID=573024 RepID=A0A1N7HNC3_9RHOB|nr:hypothetical protein [Roseovarius nanhaiticus]SEL39612.1 hypothetical protein SAMN05216208_0021 [Roseovarius nanhaiticus]SIS26349.1 hypothetical protein SAMN05421666_3520 [Roseovarius nanhaiticus]